MYSKSPENSYKACDCLNNNNNNNNSNSNKSNNQQRHQYNSGATQTQEIMKKTGFLDWNNKQQQQLKNKNTKNNNSKSQQQQQQVNGVSKKPPQTIEIRKEEVLAIRNRFPTKIPVIVQRFVKETHLPQLDKSKFLVPQEITMPQFQTIIRNRIRLNSNQALYLLVNNKSMVSQSLTLAEVYGEYADADGFLYITYASQEVFGNNSYYNKSEDYDHIGYKTRKNCKLYFKTI